MVRIIISIILLIAPLTTQAELYTTEEWISRYLSKCPKVLDNRVCYNKTKRNFKRMLKHKKLVLKYLDEYGLPPSLAIIPLIESEYTANAISKSGAVGMWQIMPYNIRHYLTSHRVILEYEYRIRPTIRKAKKLGLNVETNTEIACKMLKYLYEKYGKDNHETVVRAYNAGETRIDKALKGLGKPLKPETLNYYHQLLALKQIMEGADVFLSD